MAKPKIQLSDDLQETIEYNQRDNFENAKGHICFLDELMSNILTGNFFNDWDAPKQIEILQELDEMKREYKSFITE